MEAAWSAASARSASAGAGLMPVAAQQQTAAVASDNPLSGDPDAIKAGRQLFNTWCTQCHGARRTAMRGSANMPPI